jgi:hypothetical protein
VATITESGFERLADDDVAARFRSLLDNLSATRGTTSMGAAPGSRSSGSKKKGGAAK